MTAVIYKGSSGTARNARLALIVPEAPKEEPVPDRRDQTIALLTAERDDLQRKLREIEEVWRQRAEELRAEARDSAERDFARDDAARIDKLAAGIEAGLTAFETQLVNYARSLAPRLAQQAMSQLVDVRAGEADWLLRSIERRLDNLKAQAVIEVGLAKEDASDDVLAALAARFRTGAKVTVDPAVEPGTARIGLRLGEILIDPQSGFERLIAMLGEGE